MKRKDDAINAAGLHIPVTPEVNTRAEKPAAEYVRHKPLACRFCGRTHVPAIGKAVILRSVKNGVAYVRSRCCERNWSLPTKEL
jgi:hypothetical protein